MPQFDDFSFSRSLATAAAKAYKSSKADSGGSNYGEDEKKSSKKKSPEDSWLSKITASAKSLAKSPGDLMTSNVPSYNYGTSTVQDGLDDFSFSRALATAAKKAKVSTPAESKLESSYYGKEGAKSDGSLSKFEKFIKGYTGGQMYDPFALEPGGQSLPYSNTAGRTYNSIYANELSKIDTSPKLLHGGVIPWSDIRKSAGELIPGLNYDEDGVQIDAPAEEPPPPDGGGSGRTGYTYYGGGGWGGGGGGGGGGEAKWNTFDYENPNAPEWWVPVAPDKLNPMSAYYAIANSMIPNVSPEDQMALATMLYNSDPDNFGMYDPGNISITIPEQLGDAERDAYYDPSRFQGILDTIQAVMGASGGKIDDAGKGYTFLSSFIDNMLNTLTSNPTEDDFREMMGAITPLLEQGKADNETYPYDTMLRMLYNPYFSAGRLMPYDKNAEGFPIYRQENKSFY